MRKYIIGFLVGLVFASAIPAYGAVSSLVGKKVGGEIAVSLNSKEVGSGIIVDGRSYLPVRATADALDLELEVTKEAINLVSDTTVVINSNNFDQIQLLIGTINGLNGLKDNAIKKRDQLIAYLSKPNDRLERAKNLLNSFTDKTRPEYEEQLNNIALLEKQVVDAEDELEALVLMIDDYDQQIADLQAQKAALEAQP